jgi:ATP-dependent helicase/DNAse subunit B
MLEKDAFTELADTLQIASVEDLKTQIKKEYSKLEHILEFVKNPATGEPTRRPLYCLLDEIQMTTAIQMGEHRSDDVKNLKERFLLRPIWQSMTEILEPTEMLLILSGTTINENSLLDVLNSSIFKFNPYAIVRDIGAFDDPDAQREYIERYLPDEQSEARKDFLKRAWGWCRGRYFQESCRRY